MAGFILASLVLLTGSGIPVFGETEEGTGTGPEGRAILEKAADFYGGLKSVSAAMEVNIELPKQFAGMGSMDPLRYELALEQPARAAFTPTGDGQEPLFIQDGKQQYQEMAPFSQYTLKESTATMAGLAVEGPGGPMIPGEAQVAGFGLDAGTPGALRDADEVVLLGEEAVGETACHHLSLKGGAFEGELWVATGDQPWIIRYRSAEPPEEPETPGAGGPGMMITPRLDFHFSDWKADPDLAGRFLIEPNEALMKVDQFSPPGGGMGGPGGEPGKDHPTLNKPAPEVPLKPLNGEPVSLLSLKGKVVVLDFWATWCKPCIMSLPNVAALAKKMEGRDVVFYAVNLMETKEKAAAFMEKEKLEIGVALDTEGKAAKAFSVKGIPHLVVIGPDGLVRQVHVGFDPGGATRLEGEIEALLAEKD